MVKTRELTVEKLASLEEITRINFPRFVHTANLPSLFDYVSKKLGQSKGNPSEVGNCQIRRDIEVSDISTCSGEGVSKSSDITKISGLVTRLNPPGSVYFDVAIVYVDSDEPEPFSSGNFSSGIKFVTTRGYDVHKLPKRETDLMADFRKEVDNYFLENK